jgi:hypothetical protein
MTTYCIGYSRERHAAHDPYTGQPLWDLECWDVVQDYGAPRPACVPTNATQDYGYLDSAGRQHVVYRRRAPADASTCTFCRPSARRGSAP